MFLMAKGAELVSYVDFFDLFLVYRRVLFFFNVLLGWFTEGLRFFFKFLFSDGL